MNEQRWEDGPVDALTEAERHAECDCDYCFGQDATCEKCCGGEDTVSDARSDDAYERMREARYDR